MADLDRFTALMRKHGGHASLQEAKEALGVRLQVRAAGLKCHGAEMPHEYWGNMPGRGRIAILHGVTLVW
jgi:hypothetical protein